MEQRNTERPGTSDRPTASGGRGRWFAAYSIAAILGVLGTAVLAVIVLGPESSASVGTTDDAAAPEQQTAFALFDEFHATLIVTPETAVVPIGAR